MHNKLIITGVNGHGKVVAVEAVVVKNIKEAGTYIGVPARRRVCEKE